METKKEHDTYMGQPKCLGWVQMEINKVSKEQAKAIFEEMMAGKHLRPKKDSLEIQKAQKTLSRTKPQIWTL